MPTENNKTIPIGNKEVKCTNLNKIYWPEEQITKNELIDYYLRMGKYLLPYLKNRPQSLNRHPDGITGESFFQKDMHVASLPDWAKTAHLYIVGSKLSLRKIILSWNQNIYPIFSLKVY